MSIRVFDDFLPDPDRVRQSALASGFGTWQPNKGDLGAPYYAGLNFYGDHAAVVESLYLRMGLVGYPNSMLFRVTNETTEKAVVHSDVGAGDVTCFVYLSHHSERSGTGFYRNRRTDSITMPALADLVKDAQEFKRLKAEIEESTAEQWDEVEFVQARYNRAVVFPSHRYHRRFPLHGFGDTEASGRMMWIGHFRKGALA